MVSKDNICIIIQGPSSNIARQRQCWNGYNYIFSTWTNDAKRNEYYDDNVIFSMTPVPPKIQSGTDLANDKCEK